MGRPKAAVNCTVLPWLSGKANCKEGRFIQTGNSLLLSDKMKALSYGARYLYLCMAMEAAGRREFEFPKKAAEKYGFPCRTFNRLKAELVEAGLISVLASGRTTREKNIYSFRIDWQTRPP